MRLAALGGLLALFVRWQPLPGAALGALAFTLTMLVEAAVLYWVSRPARRELRRKQLEEQHEELTTRQVLRFYVPLMGTTLVAALTIPLVQAGISRTTATAAETQIAAFAVAWALSMVITSPANMLHQSSLTFTRNETASAYARTQRFSLTVGAVLSVITAVIAFSSVGSGLLSGAGATPQLIDVSRRVLQVFALLPLVRAWREHCWGVLMQKRETTGITQGKAISICTAMAVMLMGVIAHVQQTAVLGAWALVIGETIEGVILHRRLNRALPSGRKPTLTTGDVPTSN